MPVITSQIYNRENYNKKVIQKFLRFFIPNFLVLKLMESLHILEWKFQMLVTQIVHFVPIDL